MRWEPIHVQRTRYLRDAIGRIDFDLSMLRFVPISDSRRAELERDRARLVQMLADAEKGEAER